ncbi:monosaccharide ABC transporter membrane protein, CUT2 family [Rhizobiales bacterium GAS191]|jgi:ribose transport system permease protein|nr:monosaccharide ABC transporter membrane protein, CUT2 family [Rhizobiales bacterium GAS113]SED35280.1 monosaccharide ABC transporter membrane protein, CUT2 family [Rhizobiales bacterium GAS191]
MSDVAALPRVRPSFRLPAAATIALLSAFAFIVVALATGESAQLSASGISGLLQRMVALGIVAIGQTLVIVAGSIDLSVAHLISVSAVLASYVMQGSPERILPAVAAVLAIAALVGLVNGVLVARLAVNPLIATLGTGLILKGLLSTSFDNFAGSVAPQFQLFAYGSIGPVSFSLMTLAVLWGAVALLLRRTVFGAHLYAVGGNATGARLAGIRTERVIIGAHMLASLLAGVTGLYLASRLGSGAPWVGRDGLYDLESIAVVVIGGTLLSGGKGGVAGTLAGVLLFAVLDASFNMIGIDPFLKQILRGTIVVASVAVYTFKTKAFVG